jgi:hypothetical protein
MEPHKKLSGTDQFNISLNLDPVSYFKEARRFAFHFYKEEIEKIRSVEFSAVSPELFFSEYIWVVHATGFSAKAVGVLFNKLIPAYGTISSLSNESSNDTFGRVSKVINNRQKSDAVHKTAKILSDGIDKHGWAAFRDSNFNTPDKPYIGPVTKYHLARNTGMLDAVKPDLHLVRMAEHWGFGSPVEMCEHVKPVDLPLGIVDLVMWYSASTFGTVSIRKDGER